MCRSVCTVLGRVCCLAATRFRSGCSLDLFAALGSAEQQGNIINNLHNVSHSSQAQLLANAGCSGMARSLLYFYTQLHCSFSRPTHGYSPSPNLVQPC